MAPLKIILGAGKTQLPGWVSTQEDELDLLDRGSFEAFFNKRKAFVMLAEHVWEHMTKEEGMLAAQNCFEFLEDGGYLRVAVPDRNFRNAAYQQLVGVGTQTDPNHPAYSHKILYDAETLRAVFESAGFAVNLLEYCDANGGFHYHHWNENDGRIGRSFRFDTRNSAEKLGMVSIILDARKPLIMQPDASAAKKQDQIGFKLK